MTILRHTKISFKRVEKRSKFLQECATGACRHIMGVLDKQLEERRIDFDAEK